MEENQVTIKILPQPKPHFMLNSGPYGAEGCTFWGQRRSGASQEHTQKGFDNGASNPGNSSCQTRYIHKLEASKDRRERALIKPGQSSSVSSS